MLFYPLFSGSSGNCYVIKENDTTVLLDAGRAGKAITEALRVCRISPESIDAIVVTHEHRDHVSGVGVLSRKYNIPVYANAATWAAMEPITGSIASKNIRIIETGSDFFIGKLNIIPFAISHDSAEPVAYTFYAGKRKLTCATDMGHVTRDVEEMLKKSNLVLVESNHDVNKLKSCGYPESLKRRILSNRGHLSNENCGELLSTLYEHGTSRAILGHLSRESNTEELAYSSVINVLKENGIRESDMEIYVAHRDSVS